MSNRSDSITVNIFRLDLDNIRRKLDVANKVDDIPDLLITRYNQRSAQKSDTSDETYTSYKSIEEANSSKTAVDNKMKFFKKNQSTFVTHSWVNFFQKQEINLGDVKVTVPHIVCFIVKDSEVYAVTTGSAYVVFESFIDQTFPIEIAKRILEPEVKGGKQQAISGDIQAADIYFRRPVRIGLTESHQEVWKNLSGSLIKDIRNGENFTEIFGKNKSVKVDVKSSLKFSCRLDKPTDLIKLIEWLKGIEDVVPTEIQKQAFAFYDSIRPLSNRKDKDLIENLYTSLSDTILSAKVNIENVTLSHENISQFLNADTYSLTFQGRMLHKWDSQPTLTDVSNVINVNKNIFPEEISNRELLEKINIKSHYEDNKWENTDGNVLQHISGEFEFNGICFYILNGEWFQVEKSFQDVTDSELEEILKKDTNIRDKQHSEIGLSDYNQQDEADYNYAQKGKNTIWCDKVFYTNIELADLINFSDTSYINIIHVKRGFNASTRDLASQIRNSINCIENDLRIEGKPAINTYYEALVNNSRIDPSEISKSKFVELFSLKRRYIFSYISPKEITESQVKSVRSSVAKNELVSLVQFSKRLSVNAELKIVWIPEKKK